MLFPGHFEHMQKIVDIYSVGLRFADDDGRPVQNDLDVLNMFKNYSGSTVIHLYAKRDINSRGLIYKLPSDNPNLASDIAPIPIVTNVKIMGELKVNQKVMVYGAISKGVETASIAEFFITMNKNLDIENGLTPISSPSKEKELELPLQAVGQFVVAKLTPMTEDGKSGDPKYAISQTFVKRRLATHLFPKIQS
ncbi:187-kDa microtubule-associated protein AIR9-like isoform X5 [Euphorbia lathyris]|uniref:187-kDa microtubule-associated protein AIR9-like isoform X5 n=1 Tax=Euphorbia lathyris TaxID=212925 RepID=UPI0033132BB7